MALNPKPSFLLIVCSEVVLASGFCFWLKCTVGSILLCVDICPWASSEASVSSSLQAIQKEVCVGFEKRGSIWCLGEINGEERELEMKYGNSEGMGLG